jgi:hypothetical protein
MLRHAREAAPLVVAAIVVPGALLLSTSWTSAAVPGLDITEQAEASVASATNSVPTLVAGAGSPPASTVTASAGGHAPQALPLAPADQPTQTTVRAAVAAAAALTALGLGSAMGARYSIGP